MVVGGYYSGRFNTAELISLDPVNHPVPACLKTLAPYPEKINAASGGTLKNGVYQFHALIHSQDNLLPFRENLGVWW